MLPSVTMIHIKNGKVAELLAKRWLPTNMNVLIRMRKFKDEYAGAVEGTFRDIKNAKRYGRDAYISRGFGQGNSDTPKDKGSQKFAEGGMVNATVRPMGMMGGGNVGYTHGGKVDGCSSIQMSGRRPGKTY
jgi:hypothetical protein